MGNIDMLNGIFGTQVTNMSKTRLSELIGHMTMHQYDDVQIKSSVNFSVELENEIQDLIVAYDFDKFGIQLTIEGIINCIEKIRDAHSNIPANSDSDKFKLAVDENIGYFTSQYSHDDDDGLVYLDVVDSIICEIETYYYEMIDYCCVYNHSYYVTISDRIIQLLNELKMQYKMICQTFKYFIRVNHRELYEELRDSVKARYS